MPSTPKTLGLLLLVVLVVLAAAAAATAASAAQSPDSRSEPILELPEAGMRVEEKADVQADALYYADNDPEIWRELQPDETCPRGSHVRLDMTTGKRYVKRAETAYIRMSRVLQGADEETAERVAHLRTLSESEFEKGIAEMWNERQALLSGARNASQHEAANKEDPLNITVLLRQAGDASAKAEVRSQVLQLLNDIADDLEEAQGEFAKVGGLEACVAILRGDEHEMVLRDALLLLGTAIKSDNHMQTLALNAGALSAIAPLLSNGNDQVAIKAVYALGALLRGCSAAQRAVTDHHGKLPQSILTLIVRDATRLKAGNLVGDLLLEGEPALLDLFKLGGLCDSVWDSQNEHFQEQHAKVCTVAASSA